MKNKDSLEKFIEINRSKFDLHESPKDLFDRIEKEMDKRNNAEKYRIIRYWLKIASILFIPIVAGSLVFILSLEKNQKSNSNSTANIEIIDKSMLDLIETESFYNNRISNQYIKLQSLASNNPEIIVEVAQLKKDLDKEYSLLTIDLQQNLNKEVVINAMINQQRLQLQTINDMINQISTSTN
jgi:hypothetical protein